jgi:hypothetical protein
MFDNRLLLTSATLFALLSAFGQPSFAQSPKETSGSTARAPLAVNPTAQSNAALLGPLEVGLTVKPAPAPALPTRVTTIEPDQKLLLAPGPVPRGAVGPAYDRGVQVVITNP